MPFSYWILILLPIIILLFVLPARKTRRIQQLRIVKKRKQKGSTPMTNESLTALIGQTCLFATTSDLSSTSGKVLSVEENWITIEDKKGQRKLVNADYVTMVLPQAEKTK